MRNDPAKAHPSFEEWADYSRGLGSESDARRFDTHLATGCRKCHDVLELWRNTHGVGRRMQAANPPAESLRIVKAAFAAYKPRAVRRGWELARLVFDSFLAPQPVGVRAASFTTSAARQVLVQGADFVVDLRLEALGVEKVSLVGQVLRSSHGSAPVAEAPVVLQKGSKTVAGTITNPLGEFHLEYAKDSGLMLIVSIPAGKPLAVVLPEMQPGRPRAGMLL